jgi:glutathione S-transferase
MDGKPFICGERVTMADILLFDLCPGRPADQPDLANIGVWYARMKARPSAAA